MCLRRPAQRDGTESLTLKINLLTYIFRVYKIIPTWKVPIGLPLVK